jgi:predicted kinase
VTQPLVVLVSGPPAAGKTTLARGLAPRLQLPLIAKDDIKESLSDTLQKTSLRWSKRLGAATWDVMFVLFERFVSAGASAIFESNFYPDLQRSRLLTLRSRYPFLPVEIHCIADPVTLARRNNERERHAAHHSRSGITAEIAATWALNNGALGLSEHLIEVDTGSPEPVDLDAIVAYIGEARHGSSIR